MEPYKLGAVVMAQNEGLFHLHVDWISRADGRDVVAAAAYRSASRLENDTKGSASDFRHKAERTLHSEILVPPGSPDWALNRARLWNAVEAVEKRKDARLATEIEFALPYGVPRDKWAQLAREMASEYVEAGHVVDFSIHLGEDGTNPHVHMLLPMRRLTEDGFAAKKNREMDRKSFLNGARKRWAQVANIWLASSGSRARIDHRSYKERGLDRQPGRHWRPDPEERARKRTIAYNQRQEVALSRQPTMDERFRYPHLTQREEWPPKTLHPEPGMTAVERKELDAYRESLARDMPEREPSRTEAGLLRDLDANIRHERETPSERPERPRQERKKSEVRPDVREAQFGDYERELKREELENAARDRDRRENERTELRERAMNQLFYTREEAESLKIAKDLKSPEALREAKERIIEQRMERIEVEDRAKKNREIERQQREFLRNNRDRDDDRDRR